MKVLLLVDIQNDFCPGGPLGVPDGDQVVPVANALMRSGEFDLVVASRDWHSVKHKAFAAMHQGKKPFDQMELNGVMQTLWPTHCVEGTKGAEFHPDLDVSRIDHQILKGLDVEVDSNSAFFDNAHRNETPLRAYLDAVCKSAGIARKELELYEMGLAGDICVFLTGRDAAELGYSVKHIVDGCRSVNIIPGEEFRTLRELASLGVELVESREILAGLQPARSLPSPIERRTERGLTV